MAWLRGLLGILLMGLIGLPALAGFGILAGDPLGWQVWLEGDRLLSLAGNTLYLLAGTLIFTLPVGVVLAILLYRTDLPGQRLLRMLLFLVLFMPLPLVVAGWLGFFQAREMQGAWIPWKRGFFSAWMLHALASLPWVVLLVGQGLQGVEPELEEDALLHANPWRVLLRVTLPLSAPWIGVAVLWVAVQTANEIVITDLLQIRTFAEEINTQFVAPEVREGGTGDPVARAVAATLPWLAVTGLIVVVAVRRWHDSLPADDQPSSPFIFRLGWRRWPAFVVAFGAIGLLLGVPFVGMVHRTGQSGSAEWSAPIAVRQLIQACRIDGGTILWNLAIGLVAGLLTATLALVLCWAGRESKRFQVMLLSFLAAVWALPGALIGIGLKQTIHGILDIGDQPWLARLLYHGPSMAPLLWVDGIRFLPVATAMLWPVVQRISRDTIDAARIDGASPTQEFFLVIWPLTQPAWVSATGAVAILSLGELSAGKLVATPGCPGYAQELFARMHYGWTPDLAAGSLLLLGLVTVTGLGFLVWSSRESR